MQVIGLDPALLDEYTRLRSLLNSTGKEEKLAGLAMAPAFLQKYVGAMNRPNALESILEVKSIDTPSDKRHTFQSFSPLQALPFSIPLGYITSNYTKLSYLITAS